MHPIFREANFGSIPGFDIPSFDALTTQATSFQPLNDDNVRKFKEFQKEPTLLKNAPPVIIQAAYDKKMGERVSLLYYKYKDGKHASDFLKEHLIVVRLNDKNVLKFYGIVYNPNNDGMYFAFEYFDVFLSQLLCEHSEMFDTSVIKCVMHQLLTGLRYLHEKRVIHRDINPKNLVITEKGFLKIANFRNAQWINEKSKVIQTAEFSYQPVNVLLESKTIYTSDDIWSATCIFAELLLKKKLLLSVGKTDVLYEILSLFGYPDENLWPEFVELPDYQYLDTKNYHKLNFLGSYFNNFQYLDLLQRGFDYNPKYKISADEFMMHSYFQENPLPTTIKCFGGMLHGKNFTFPVKY